VSKTLLDTYLPDYQFSERHTATIRAEPRAVLDAVADYDFTQDRFNALLMSLRSMPGRGLSRFLARNLAMPKNFNAQSFVPLGRDGDREIASGLIGRFWRLDGGLVPIANADAFRVYAEPGVPKLVMNFRADTQASGTRLSTETRVYCPDQLSRLCFTPYWYAIRLGSGLIRHRMLAGIRARFG
jgi:hypothetical protein